MIPETISDAVEEIVELFRAVWSPRKCDYPGTKFDIKDVAKTDAWARIRVQHEGGGQRTLASLDGKSRFARTGSVIIELHNPLGVGVLTPYAVAESVVNAYEGKRTLSGVWFRNVRIQELNENTAVWYPILVIAEFDYEQIN